MTGVVKLVMTNSEHGLKVEAVGRMTVITHSLKQCRAALGNDPVHATSEV